MDNSITFKNLRTEEDVEVFMSFGMLQDLLKILGSNPEQIVALDVAPELSEIIIAALIAKRDKTGKVRENPVFDVSIDDAERIFDWVKEHLINYFLRRLSNTKNLFESRKDEMTRLGFSPSGTPVDPLKTA